MFWKYYVAAGFAFLLVFVEDFTRIFEQADNEEDGEVALAMHFAEKYGGNHFPQLFVGFFTIFFIFHVIVASIVFKVARKK